MLSNWTAPIKQPGKVEVEELFVDDPAGQARRRRGDRDALFAPEAARSLEGRLKPCNLYNVVV